MRAPKLSDDQLQEMYHALRLSRAFEERLSLLHRQGKILGGIYSGIGQEAITVGSAYGLRREDFISPLHRDLGALLVKGVPPGVLMAQVFGKRDGLSRGKDSYLHSGDTSLGVYGNTSMLGSNLPVACGLAYGFKLRSQDHVVVAYFGEGAANYGDVHEAMNFAAIQRLGIVFVCENNLYAYSTPFEKAFAIPEVSVRAQAYGFPGVDVYGNDLLRVYAATQRAIARARAGEGPTLIECKTFRWHGHSEHDKASYRTEEELLEWKARDPIPQFERYLTEKRLLNDASRDEMTARVEREIDEAVAFAESSPWPEGPEALEDIYAP
ncbi:MAG TPA: thiamine pyrophosphate-dependent dehydrogenase E1 component subunit alpha [Methylomirabilota bacterium]|nr:thiamine pyrophosphate-dependent dehydrogenase E1 component subunit alpha [Methylomirabilota bacterium]